MREHEINVSGSSRQTWKCRIEFNVIVLEDAQTKRADGILSRERRSVRKRNSDAMGRVRDRLYSGIKDDLSRQNKLFRF